MLETWISELVQLLLIMNKPVRKRSSSWNPLNKGISSDEEDYWSTTSTRKPSNDPNTNKNSAVKSSTVGQLPDFNSGFTLEDFNELLLAKSNRFQRNIRSHSNTIVGCVCRRGSISLPEMLDGLPSGQLSNRLSLVADELEESFKKMRRTDSGNVQGFSLLNLLSSRRGSNLDQ